MLIDRSLLSGAQRENLQAALQAYHEGKSASAPRPVALFVELTRNCISRCRYCRRKWTNDPAFDMSRDVFRHVIEDCAPYASFIDVRSYGESLMLPDFPWYLERLARVCPNLRITTTLGCGSQESLDALVEHDVFVSVSFDAANKELYERYRRGAQYDVVIRNLERVACAMRSKHGSLRGRMRLGIAPLYADNLDHVDGVLDLAHRLGIPEVRIVPLTSAWYDLNLLAYHKRRVLQTLAGAIRKAEACGIELQLASPVLSALRLDDRVCARCFKPWFYAVIMFDGTIRVCDWQIELEHSADDLGNVRAGVEAAWNGEVATRIRRSHLGVGRRSAICRGCYRVGRYSDHEHDLAPSFRRWLVTGSDVKSAVDAILRRERKA
jgi:MoaA/NifB/PqqE/SkfB family radical SAM enzyme